MGVLTSFVLIAICTIQIITCDDDDTLVQVEQGWVRGEKLKTVVGNSEYYSYKGIRYGKPPIGNLRFKAPEKADPWDEVLNATKHGNVCPQLNKMNGVFTPGSEDCLFLNIYTPNIKPDAPLPVLCFIHGGGYMFGSGDSDIYGPDYIMTNGEAVLVTINYRVGVLGFLAMDNEAVPGNAALKDQVLAMKWVKNNIESFGGNPNCVTLLGDTAGGQSVTLHMLSPMSKGLFHKAIAMSGAPTCDYAYSYQPARRAEILGESLNCEDVYDHSALLDCLQNAQVESLFNFDPTILASEENNNILFKMLFYAPVIEKPTGNNFITEDYYTALKNGNVNKEVSLLIGYAEQESTLLVDLIHDLLLNKYKRYNEMFVPSEILTKCTPDTILDVAYKIKNHYFGDKKVNLDNLELFLNYMTDVSIGNHVLRFANKWAALEDKTYLFKVDCFTDWNVYGQLGVKYGFNKTSHFDSAYYVFYPQSLNWSVSADSLEYQLAQNFISVITSFAKTSDPSIQGVEWQKFSISQKNFMTFTNDGMVPDCGPDEKSYTFWNDIFEGAGLSY